MIATIAGLILAYVAFLAGAGYVYHAIAEHDFSAVLIFSAVSQC